MAYRRAVDKVVDIMEGHGEGGEGQHHALLHIAFLETVPSLAHAVAPTPQLVYTYTQHTLLSFKLFPFWRMLPPPLVSFSMHARTHTQHVCL